MSADEVGVEHAGAVRTITINRPQRRNALSQTVVDLLVEAVIDADDDDAVRVLVLTGAGQQAFCAGADLKEMREQAATPERATVPMRGSRRNLLEVVTECTKPTIAAVNGHAVAGGFELALACDIRIASALAEFGLPEAKRGMGAHFGSVVLPRMVPLGVALELLFTGDVIDAQRAYALGLVNDVVAPDEVVSAARTLAERIAANAPISVRRMKAMATRGLSLPLAAALRLDEGPNPYLSEDRWEGVAAFVERRAPRWKNR